MDFGLGVFEDGADDGFAGREVFADGGDSFALGLSDLGMIEPKTFNQCRTSDGAGSPTNFSGATSDSRGC